LVEDALHGRAAHALEDVDQPELAQQGEQVLDPARAAEGARRHAHDSDRLVDVLLQAAAERVLQAARIPAIVFRWAHDEGAGAGPRATGAQYRRTAPRAEGRPTASAARPMRGGPARNPR